MSTELFGQAICAAGHLWEAGDFRYDGVKPPESCPYCSASWIWSRTWDVTNESIPDDQLAVEIAPALAMPPGQNRQKILSLHDARVAADAHYELDAQAYAPSNAHARYTRGFVCGALWHRDMEKARRG
ncbi:MAG: hypothetical protein K0U16_07650 [Gammaproteobacteria bacterium]|nr:hypothetical protein [Gammaproteobacteria bacterium]